MLKKLLPVIMILIGGGAGVAAGIFLQAPPEVSAEDSTDTEVKDKDGKAQDDKDKPAKEPNDTEDAYGSGGGEKGVGFEYAKMSNQFVVPLVRGEVVRSMVVMSLSLEVKYGTTDDVYTVEPRLRDSFLRVMFDHAAIGGFDGAFANNQNLKRLRRALKEEAYATLGDRLNDVLITDIVRQDL